METTPELDWERARQVTDACLFTHSGKHLTDIEVAVLEGSWLGKSYEEIADTLFLSVSYINKDVGYRLWKKLSVALGEEVTKKSFRQALQRHSQQQLATPLMDNSDITFPDSFVPLDSPYYVQRGSIEADCETEIRKPGALIRIRAPQRTGKTSLLHRLLTNAESAGYRTVRLNLRNVEKNTLGNLDKFLRWFCANINRQLGLDSQINDYWDEEIGSKVSCTGYMQSYILEELETNLVIGLDEIDTIFSYPDIAEDFLALLREWHEEAALEPSWQKLRLVIAHATEVYISLNIYQSPFNVGLPIELPPFTAAQVTALAQQHGLTWTDQDTDRLMTLVGGHPYLIRLAFYHLVKQGWPLADLLAEAPTPGGIYSSYLRGCLERLKSQPELLAAAKQMLADQPPQRLEPTLVYQLDSLGLIQIRGDRVVPSCELYRQYLGQHL
jgi:AAA-like domain